MPIRLACEYCDTEECAHIEVIPIGWADIREIQFYGKSLEEIRADDKNRTMLEWFTHLGVCPECQKDLGF